jgi:hypothetical protein
VNLAELAAASRPEAVSRLTRTTTKQTWSRFEETVPAEIYGFPSLFEITICNYIHMPLNDFKISKIIVRNTLINLHTLFFSGHENLSEFFSAEMEFYKIGPNAVIVSNFMLSLRRQWFPVRILPVGRQLNYVKISDLLVKNG